MSNSTRMIRWMVAAGVAGQLSFALPAVAEPNDDLIEAARQGSVQGIRSSLDEGASLSSADSQGYSVLHWAVSSGVAEAVMLLLEQGANINGQSNLGAETPLIVAVKNKDAQMVKLLVEHGANIKLGTSPEHDAHWYAKETGDATIVALLRAPAAADRAPVVANPVEEDVNLMAPVVDRRTSKERAQDAYKAALAEVWADYQRLRDYDRGPGKALSAEGKHQLNQLRLAHEQMGSASKRDVNRMHLVKVRMYLSQLPDERDAFATGAIADLAAELRKDVDTLQKAVDRKPKP